MSQISNLILSLGEYRITLYTVYEQHETLKYQLDTQFLKINLIANQSTTFYFLKMTCQKPPVLLIFNHQSKAYIF